MNRTEWQTAATAQFNALAQTEANPPAERRAAAVLIPLLEAVQLAQSEGDIDALMDLAALVAETTGGSLLRKQILKWSGFTLGQIAEELAGLLADPAWRNEIDALLAAIEPESDTSAQSVSQKPQRVYGNQQNITGNVTGPVVAGNVGRIGDTHTTRTVNTGGGTYVERDVNISGGDFVGRDKVNVSGGFYQPGWTVTGGVTQSMGDLTQYFAPLEAAVRAASPENRQQAQAKVEELKAETAKGERADDEKMAGLVDELGGLIPGAVEALIGLFAPSALGKLAGGATKYVLRRLRRR